MGLKQESVDTVDGRQVGLSLGLEMGSWNSGCEAMEHPLIRTGDHLNSESGIRRYRRGRGGLGSLGRTASGLVLLGGIISLALDHDCLNSDVCSWMSKA